MDKTSKRCLSVKCSGVKSPGLQMRDLEGAKAQQTRRGTLTILSPDGGLSPGKETCPVAPW